MALVHPRVEAAELREGLSPHDNCNPQDAPGAQSLSSSKISLLQHQELSQEKALRADSAAGTSESGCQCPNVQELPTATSSLPELMAEDQLPIERSQPRNPAEDQKESSASKSEMVEVDENESILQLKLEAMTWAAMAKDYFISSLGKKYKAVLNLFKAEKLRSRELESLLHNSRQQQEVMAQELQDAKEQINKLADAEERLCAQLGNLEAEGIQEDRRYRSQIATLTEKIKAQNHFIAHSLKSLKSGRPVQVFVKDQSIKLQSDLSRAQDNEQSLSAKLEMALKEIKTQRGDLSDTKTDLRVSEVLRRNQTRRLKVLEKERRYLMRKGATRSVRVAPRPRKENETETPGGEGWKVFSILEFEG